MENSEGIVENLANQVGLPIDLIKTLLLMMTNIPLSLGFRCIKNTNLRYVYSLVPGLVSLVYLQQHWALYVLACALVPFILWKIIGNYHYLISIFTSISFLLFIHIYRYMYDYMGWKIDCSVSIMYLVTKVVYYGNYGTHHKQKISIFSYLAYCFFFPSTLIGPAFNVTTFENFIHQTNGYESPKIQSKLLLKQIGKAITFGIATIFLIPIFTPYWPLQNQWYLSQSPLIKFLMLNIIGVIYRLKFYTAWSFTQIAIDFSGLSWDEKEQNYNSVRCGSSRFQTELNPRNKTVYWNTSVQIWLKEMFYDKVMSATKSSGLATFVTFFVSALWHGVYLAYYIGFIQWAIIITVSKWGYRMSQAIPKISHNILVKGIAFVISSSLMNYAGMFIVVLTWPEAVQCYENMHFIGTFLMITLLVTSFFIKPKLFKPKHHHKHKGENESAHPQQNSINNEPKHRKQ